MKFIAELCQNHNGDNAVLKNLIRDAFDSGAHYAKIQALYSEELVKRKEFESRNRSRFSMYRPFKDELTRLKKLDLDQKQEADFVVFCQKVGIIPMITVFSRKGVLRAQEAGFEHIKIASYDSTNFDLISSVSSFAKSVIISTGATTVLELKSLLDFLNSNIKKIDITLLHCKTIYPNELNDINLNRMLWLKKTGFNVGFSDHTRTYRDNYKPYSDRNLPSLVAINMGAKLLERHFTNLPPNVTKDGKISISKTDLQKLVKFSKKTKTEQKILLQKNQKKIELIMGGDNFEPSTEEFWNRSYYKGRVKTTTKNKSNNF